MATRRSNSDAEPAADAPYVAPLVPPNVPPPTDIDAPLQAGPGQVVVTSPTGLKSVVDEAAVESLKPQGYTVD